MKTLMLGNRAIAQGLWQAGCDFISSYPGTPSTEITELAATLPDIYCEWAPNEKVALESAFGACLAGHRAACAMKHVGLNVAADPLFSSSYTGVNAALVIFVADDPGLHSSQNEQDSRHYAKAAKLPMLEPATSQEALDFTVAAFELSELFDTPVIIRINTRIAHSQSIVQYGNRSDHFKPYYKNPSKFVMVPAFAKARHPVVEQRLRDFADSLNSSDLNRIDGFGSTGFIASSSSYLFLKELFADSVKILKLGCVFPLPIDLIRDFAKSVDRLFVVEELDLFIADSVRARGINSQDANLPAIGELSSHIIAESFNFPVPRGLSLDSPIPIRPPVMCPGCPHRGLKIE